MLFEVKILNFLLKVNDIAQTCDDGSAFQIRFSTNFPRMNYSMFTELNPVILVFIQRVARHCLSCSTCFQVISSCPSWQSKYFVKMPVSEVCFAELMARTFEANSQ